MSDLSRSGDSLRYAVITVSDRSAAGERDDRSGPEVDRLLAADLPVVRVDHRIVPDERPVIAEALRDLADGQQVDVILTSGGTGLAPRDVTPEATLDVAEREIPGIAEYYDDFGDHTPGALREELAALKKRLEDAS